MRLLPTGKGLDMDSLLAPMGTEVDMERLPAMDMRPLSAMDRLLA